MGFEAVIRSFSVVRASNSGRVLGGVGILEDAHHKDRADRGDPAPRRKKESPGLVKQWMPRLLFNEIDILIVDEIGKQISSWALAG